MYGGDQLGFKVTLWANIADWWLSVETLQTVTVPIDFPYISYYNKIYNMRHDKIACLNKLDGW